MKRILSLSCALAASLALMAQSGIDADYAEPADPATPDTAAWAAVADGLHAAWASRDEHYAKRRVPEVTACSDTTIYAWRGERVGVQAVLYSRSATKPVRLSVSGTDAALTDGTAARFVNYVKTDERRGCGNNPHYGTDHYYLIPDVIDRPTTKVLPAMSARPVWVSVEVPRSLTAGTYRLVLDVSEEGAAPQQLALNVVVRERALPEPADYAFNLNFWMQPYAVSRYLGVEQWSAAHFDALRPYMKMLARAGQKVATAILFYEPWGVQSNDKFEPMVETTRAADGSWRFSYDVFDRWISFLDSCGIDRQINCFSMVPWDMSFRYVDAATGQYAYLTAKTTDAAYRELWTAFIKDFAAHLRAKGWYDRTCIAMDERGLGDMLNAYDIAQAAVPGIKMALAGTYHAELVDKLYDYCLGYGETFSPAELARRNARGWVSTTYTACPDLEPNVCSNNRTADAAYLPIYSIANGFNGFLRWAWMNWTDEPLQDTRFKLFTAGDTYMVYPGARSSLRFERIIEGVQQAEKVRLLREEYAAKGQHYQLAVLNAAVRAFKSGLVGDDQTTARLVRELEEILNK